MQQDVLIQKIDEINREPQMSAKCVKLKRLFDNISSDFIAFITSKPINLCSDKDSLIEYINICSKIIRIFSYLNNIGDIIANFIQRILIKYNDSTFVHVFLYRILIISVAILYESNNYDAIAILTNYTFIDKEGSTHTFASFNVSYCYNEINLETGDNNITADHFLESISNCDYADVRSLLISDTILANYELYCSRGEKTDVHCHWIPLYRITIEMRENVVLLFKSIVDAEKAIKIAKIYGFKDLAKFKNRCAEIELNTNNIAGTLYELTYRIQPYLIFNYIKSNDIGIFNS